MEKLQPAPSQYDRGNEQGVREELEKSIRDLERKTPKFSIDATLSAAASRSLTAASSTADVLAVLATLIADLRKKGVLG